MLPVDIALEAVSCLPSTIAMQLLPPYTWNIVSNVLGCSTFCIADLPRKHELSPVAQLL